MTTLGDLLRDQRARRDPTLLRTAIQAAGLSARRFAGVLGSDERTVRHWLAGDRRMPGPAMQLCRAVIEYPLLARWLLPDHQSAPDEGDEAGPARFRSLTP